MPHVMLVEDDPMIRLLVAHHLLDHGWRVTTLKDGSDLDRMMLDEPVDLLLIDLGLPHVDGLSLVEGLREKGIATPVLILTAYELPHLLAMVESSGANDLMQKPFEEDELFSRMQRLIAA